MSEAERQSIWTEITRLEGQKKLHDQKENTAVTVIVVVLIVGIPAGLFRQALFGYPLSSLW